MDYSNLILLTVLSAVFSLIFSILASMLLSYLRDYSTQTSIAELNRHVISLNNRISRDISAETRQGNKERMGEAVAAATEAYGKIMKESPDLDKRQVMLKVIAEVGMQYPDVALQLGKQMLSGKNPLKGLGL